MAFGVIPTHNGYAIRCKPSERIAVEKALMPEYTEAVGDDLLALSKNEGYRVVLTGVPREMTNIELVKQTTIGSWKCMPCGLGPRCNVYGKKNVVATCLVLPPKSLIRLFIANTNQSYMASIKEEVRSRQQLSKGWDLVGKGGKTVTEEFVNNAGAPEVRPVSTARPKMHAQRPGSAWTKPS